MKLHPAVRALLPVDPNAYQAAQAWPAAQAYAAAFCELNGIPVPRRYVTEPITPGLKPFDPRGYGEARIAKWLIYVNVRNCPRPIRGKPVRAWSFTGYKADRTVPGVTLHELGHLVHAHLLRIKGVGERTTWPVVDRALWRVVESREPKLTSYEPNEGETFAEAFRLFALNPELLREGRPYRWQLMVDLGLKPLHSLPWTEVLRHAHPAYHQAARNWMWRAPASTPQLQLP